MKTAAEIANHPRAVLARRMVEILRATGSREGAEAAWTRLALQPTPWRKLVTYGLTTSKSQAELTQIAFPDSNVEEVEIALAAGNRVNHVYEVARGRAAIARDANGKPKLGLKGMKIVRFTTR